MKPQQGRCGRRSFQLQRLPSLRILSEITSTPSKASKNGMPAKVPILLTLLWDFCSLTPFSISFLDGISSKWFHGNTASLVPFISCSLQNIGVASFVVRRNQVLTMQWLGSLQMISIGMCGIPHSVACGHYACWLILSSCFYSSEDIEKVTDPRLRARVHIENLVKQYTKNYAVPPAVDKLNLTLYESQITALLGHNGAGE